MIYRLVAKGIFDRLGMSEQEWTLHRPRPGVAGFDAKKGRCYTWIRYGMALRVTFDAASQGGN